MDEIQRRLGARIKRLRERRGLTQAQIAERCRYSTKFVSEVERGVVNVPLLTLCAFGRALGATASELLLGVDVPVSARKIESLERLLAGRPPAQQRQIVRLLSAMATLMGPAE